MASLGHSGSHAPQLMHSSVIIVAMIYGSFSFSGDLPGSLLELESSEVLPAPELPPASTSGAV
jgi:hypothetical protein